MSVLLFSLRGVPEDEAEEIRALLTEYEIDFFETSAGNWGISMPALWLQNESELSKANALLEEYQKDRYSEQREIYQQLKKAGKNRTCMNGFKENPIRVVVSVAIILLILYISTKPFLMIDD